MSDHICNSVIKQPRFRFLRTLITAVNEVCGNYGILGEFGSPCKGKSDHTFLAFLPFPFHAAHIKPLEGIVVAVRVISKKFTRVASILKPVTPCLINIKWKRKSEGGKVYIWLTFPTSSRMAAIVHPDPSPFGTNNWHTHTVNFWYEHWTDIMENIHADDIILQAG